MQLFLKSVVKEGENFHRGPRGSIVSITVFLLPHEVFSGSIYTLNLKWSTFLRRKRQEHVYFMEKAIFFCIAKTAHWNRMGSFLSNVFLVVFNIWSSPLTGRGCPEQHPWGGLRERKRWLIPCTPLYWCSFLPESSDPEWCCAIPITDAQSPQAQTEHCSSLTTFSFPNPLCCLRTRLHITSQQLLGWGESCFLYNYLKIFTWVWEFV